MLIEGLGTKLIPKAAEHIVRLSHPELCILYPLVQSAQRLKDLP